MRLTEDDVRQMLKDRAATLGSQAALARAMSVSPQYLGEVLLGTRPPGGSVLEPLGLERIVTYRKKETNGKSKKRK